MKKKKINFFINIIMLRYCLLNQSQLNNHFLYSISQYYGQQEENTL